MRRVVVGILIFACSLAASAQSGQKPEPPKLCVGQIRYQTATKFDSAKLRQSYLDALNAMKLAKEGTLTIVPIEGEDADDAKAEVEKAGCQFAVYTRILQKPMADNRTLETGTSFDLSKHEDVPIGIYGVQCTVERTSSGMPLLIDRRFDPTPGKGDKAVLKMLAEQASRVQDALAKKLTDTRQ